MDAYLGYKNPDTVDEKLDTEEITVGGQQVHRERLQLAGALAAAIAAVINSNPASSAYGLVIREVAPSGLGSGRNDLTNEPEKLVTDATPCRRVIITADSDNEDYVVIGDSNIVPSVDSRRGIMLGASASVTINIDDVSKIYAAAAEAGDGLSFIYEV